MTRTFLLLVLLAGPALADEVVLIPNSTVQAPGGRLRGAIERETPNDVTIAGRAVPIDQIGEVDYDNPGASFSQAAAQMKNGDLPKAIDLYQKAMTEASARPLVAQAARFARARVLADLSRRDPSKRAEAIKELEAITTTLPTSRHIGPSLEILADLKLAAKDYAGADQALEKLGTLSWAKGRAAVLRARVQAKNGQYEEALAALDRQVATMPEGTAERRAAELARSDALAGLKKYDEAEKAARAVIDGSEPEDAATLAAAYNTLGDGLRAAGKARDALFAYLHTDILYGASADEHARALSEIARLWRQLDRADRADAAIERLKAQYPTSPYLADASAP